MSAKITVWMRVALAFCFFSCHELPAQADNSERMDRERNNARLTARVFKSARNDVAIAAIPSMQEIAASAERLDNYLSAYLLYIDPAADAEKLAQNISQTGRRADGTSYATPKDIISGISKYAATRGLGFQKVPASFGGITQKIDDGVPLYCWFYECAEYEGALTERTRERLETRDMDEWAKNLRHKEIKRFKRLPGKARDVLIMGYNADTKELLVFGASKRPVWMTEKEFRDCSWNDPFAIRY